MAVCRQLMAGSTHHKVRTMDLSLKRQRVALLLLLSSVFIFNHFFYDLQPGPTPVVTSLSPLQEKTWDTILEMTKLLFSLSTAIFGLVGIFAVLHIKNERRLSKPSINSATLAFAFAAISIDFGYIFLEKWAETFGNSMFVPFDRFLTIPQTLQFSCFLMSLLFAANLALSEMTRMENGDE